MKAKRELVLFITLGFTLTIYGQGTLDFPHTNKLDSLFESFHSNEIPGGYLGIIKDDRVIYEKVFGMADIRKNRPIHKKTTFDLASVSKQFTAMCLYLLEEQGSLSLDDAVINYLPEYENLDSTIQIKHLMTHSSGIRDYVSLLGLTLNLKEKSMTNRQVEELIKKQTELNFDPGSGFLYSNSGYFLLGLIVHHVSGLSLRDYARQYIFDPLEMDDTYFHDLKGEQDNNKAMGYKKSKSGKYQEDDWDEEVVGDHNLFSTPEDMLKWARNFHDNQLGKHPQKLIKRYLTAVNLSNGAITPYTGGLYQNMVDSFLVYGHGGLSNGFRSKVIFIPEKGMSVILLSNSSSWYPVGYFNYIVELFLDRTMEPVNPESKSMIQPGIYIHDFDRELLWISKEEDAYYLNARTKLTELSNNRYASPYGATLTFDYNSALDHPKLEYNSTLYEMKEYKLLTSDADDTWIKRQHLGKYKCDNPGIKIKIKQKKEQLKISYLKIEDQPVISLLGWLLSFDLKAIKEGHIYVPLGSISLEYIADDYNDVISGFTLNGQRFMGLYFKKID